MERKFKIVRLGLGYKILLFVIAIMIAGFSLFYTNRLVNKLKTREKQRIELWAAAYKDIIETDLDQTISVISFQIINEDSDIPVIMTDGNDKIISYANLDSLKAISDEYLFTQLELMKSQNEPIVIEYSQTQKNFIYYRDSFILTQLQNYPYYQAFLVVLFVLITYILLVISKRAEDNLIWVGMSKETAHQLGTPISSLIAWVELMKIRQQDDPMIPEVVKDIKRLEMITERFARIGSEPKLDIYNLGNVIESAVEYLKPRTSSKIKYIVNVNTSNMLVNLNMSLIQWVIENLCKNAIDAMGGNGVIEIDVFLDKNKSIIEVTDTGKGMSLREQKKVFKTGYSTKKYGWGLGLALVKRIIEDYHKGKIFILKSEIDKGTTFRIELMN
ncbi:MAG: HAMP domain-containing histidine kinase [Bacteroidales bacterium]|nr:HAMP domain-containing histidine kinase [Bacteroidales bacterium]